ncbi:MAG: hydroxymethylbilane synthase [Candidatus Eremiobacteraeota bacterium]|nr:hydroxymethylbilane synthase [Candidatus Eremiobacteraeota bacterium]
MNLTCASRSSALAMIQTGTVVAALARKGIVSRVLRVSTTGDKVQDRSIAAIGAESLFVKELELALRDCRADYAVHSCKDLPSSLPDDMELCAITEREDPRDAFCSERYKTFAALPAGARVGTSSLRRRAQLCAKRPDLRYDDIRGNVDTRLKKLQTGAYDAIVLALAGLTRLGVYATFTVPFAVDDVVPAVGQGALAIEARGDERALRERLREALNDPLVELAVLAERAALRELQGGCQAPIGIHGSYETRTRTLVLRGVVASPDGKNCVRAERRDNVTSAHEAHCVGVMLAQQLHASGGAEILERLPRAPNEPLSGKLILLPRTRERSSRIAACLRADGAEVIEVASSAAACTALGERTPNMVIFPSSGAVTAILPYLQELLERGVRPSIAAMGARSAGAAQEARFTPDVIASSATVEALVAAVHTHLTTRFTEPSVL